ncbi:MULTISPECIES: hypothetical protein [unclassified Roseobacter]|uniref:hypothetical protein n=1 Tax=unclassified Roseobacter TaxID=196798 RepID=UPI0030EB4543
MRFIPVIALAGFWPQAVIGNPTCDTARFGLLRGQERAGRGIGLGQMQRCSTPPI